MGLFVVAVVGINYLFYSFSSNLSGSKNLLSAVTGSPFEFPSIWNTMTWLSSWLLYFPGFIIIFLITNEYQFKTHRQNIIDGLSRNQFVWIKLNVAFILTIFCTLFVLITTVLFGFISGSTFTFEGFEYIGYFFVCSWIYILFAVLLALLLRKAALAVGIYFIYGLIIDNIIPWFLRKSSGGKPYGTYIMPLDVADGLLPFPFLKSLRSQVNIESVNVYICLTICLAWIIFYHWFTVKKFNTEDL